MFMRPSPEERRGVAGAGPRWSRPHRLGYSPAMKDTPDIEQLARRYLDLCQNQMTALVNDPALAEGMAKAYAAMMARGAALFAGAAGGPAGSPKTGMDEPRSPSSAPAEPHPPGAAAAAPACDAAPGDVALLAGRVAELEERVRHLEAALAATGGGTPGSPSRRRR